MKSRSSSHTSPTISMFLMGKTHDLFAIPPRINVAWYLDCGRIGRPTNALLFITIDTPLFSTYAVDLSIDWGDYSTPIEKSYDYLSTGIRNSMPLWHTYYLSLIHI